MRRVITDISQLPREYLRVDWRKLNACTEPVPGTALAIRECNRCGMGMCGDTSSICPQCRDKARARIQKLVAEGRCRECGKPHQRMTTYRGVERVATLCTKCSSVHNARVKADAEYKRTLAKLADAASKGAMLVEYKGNFYAHRSLGVRPTIGEYYPVQRDQALEIFMVKHPDLTVTYLR